MADLPTVHRDGEGRIVYQPDGAVLREYLRDRSEVAIIRGPIGSGTSTASCMRIFATAMEQAKSTLDGVRRTRWAIVRSTYPQLATSTLRTWLTWFPEARYGILNRARPMHQVIRLADMELEVWFLALDLEDDIEKLRSTEYTGMWFNEVEFTLWSLFTEAYSRTGRFPRMAEGGPTWHGVIADMNAPNEEHWLPRMAGEAPYPDDVKDEDRLKLPADWKYFKQPAAVLELKDGQGRLTGYAVNPKAENLKWNTPGYYEGLVKANKKNWIDSRLRNVITFVIDGDPVWQVNQDLVFADEPLPFVAGREVIVSLDFGRRPAALMAQEIGDKLQVQREFRMYGVGAATFAPELKRFLEREYRGATVRFTGDPKGRDRGQNNDRSAYDIFAGYDMHVTPAPVRNNNLETRLEAVSYALLTNRLLVAKECTTLRPALAGKYHLKKLDVGEAEPFKDKYSDVADCLQYLCLFTGEGRRMIGLTPGPVARPVQMLAKMHSLRRVS